MNNSLIGLAFKTFRDGEYGKALQLYRTAAQKYGDRFFFANIKICELRLGLGNDANICLPLLSHIQEPLPQKFCALSILDPYTSTILSKQINLIPLDINNYKYQIKNLKYDFVLLESCWDGNNGMWRYAFTSPELKHANAQRLLDALSIIKKMGKKIIFWNKEDPMHFDRFLPIARNCDYILTTDSNCVDKYKRKLKHENVTVLPFFIDPQICNPRNRFIRKDTESVCFAGAYYSQEHDERIRQMNYILPIILKYTGAIYDRYSEDKSGKYKFPKQYESVLRASVPFSEMPSLYKKFKVFLNVNTIINSPTMLSRRVYELLGSGTPVVSSPSCAIENYFKNIVLTATSTQEADYQVNRLLTDDDYWKRISHLGYREVMEKHTYSNISSLLYSAAGLKSEKMMKPLVSIVLPSCREDNLYRIIQNITRQCYEKMEVILALTDYSKESLDVLTNAFSSCKNILQFKLLQFEKNIPLGRCINDSIRQSSGDFIAKMDDDNFYFENYLSDLLIPFKFGDFDVVGKECYFCYLEGMDKLILRYPKRSHCDTKFVAGDAMIMRRRIFEKTSFGETKFGEDSILLRNINELKGKIYSADYFNFIKFRSSNLLRQTWMIEEEELLRMSTHICNGLNFDIVKC